MAKTVAERERIVQTLLSNVMFQARYGWLQHSLPPSRPVAMDRLQCANGSLHRHQSVSAALRTHSTASLSALHIGTSIGRFVRQYGCTASDG